jgi:PAS domain S-box-containing protein
MPNSLPDPTKELAAETASISQLAYIAILNASNDAVVIANQDGTVIEFNKAAEKMFGYPRQDVIGVSMGEAIVAPRLREDFVRAFRPFPRDESRVRKNDFTVESLAVRSDGSEFPVRVSVSRVQNAAVTLFIGFIRDLSHERSLMQELHASRMEWEQCFNALPDNISILDMTGKILRANHAMEHLFSGTYGDIRGQDYRLLYCGTANPDPQPPCAAVLNGSPPVSIETELTPIPGGKTGWYVVSSYPLKDLNGVQWGAVSVVQDATERRQLQMEQDQFFRNSIDMLCVASRDGHLRLVSASLQQFLGLSNDELFDRCIADFLHADDRKLFLEQMAEAELPSSVIRVRTRMTRNDGQERWLAWHLSKANSSGGIFCGVARDITEQLKGEAELIKAREIAEKSNKAKSEFLAVVSHEMRTPLHNILGGLELIRNTPISNQCREWLDSSHDSAEQLLSLISDILDCSRVEAGKLILENSEFNLLELFLKLTPQFQKRAAEKHISFVWTIAPETPIWWYGDSGKLRQIIINLLTNAIKFTESGFVHIEVFLEAGQRDVLHIRVVDSGIGVPANRTEDIFRLFEQVDSSGTRRSGGVGLGLAICARLVELMDGKIWVDSREGVGSEFNVTCRLSDLTERSSADETQIDEHRRSAGRQQHVIVVEDDLVSARLARSMLEAEGYSVTVFHDGRALLSALSSMLPRSVDAIVMDVMMPELGGFETTRLIRGSQNWFSGLPIIATTANAMSQDAVTCLSHGMDGYLAKPFTRRCLVETVSTHLAFERTEEFVPAAEMLLEFSLKWDDLTESCNNDSAQIRELIEIVERTVPLQFSDIHGAILEKDFERLGRSIHRLKGCLGNICVGDIIERLARFEELIKHPFGLERLAFQIVVIERTVKYIIQCMTKKLQ